MEEKRTVELSAEIVQAIEDHLAELSASSVTEYVEAVLRAKLMEEGYLAPYSESEEATIEKRLRDLGYLD